jgi:hypothetical protein
MNKQGSRHVERDSSEEQRQFRRHELIEVDDRYSRSRIGIRVEAEKAVGKYVIKGLLIFLVS